MNGDKNGNGNVKMGWVFIVLGTVTTLIPIILWISATLALKADTALVAKLEADNSKKHCEYDVDIRYIRESLVEIKTAMGITGK